MRKGNGKTVRGEEIGKTAQEQEIGKTARVEGIGKTARGEGLGMQGRSPTGTAGSPAAVHTSSPNPSTVKITGPLVHQTNHVTAQEDKGTAGRTVKGDCTLKICGIYS